MAISFEPLDVEGVDFRGVDVVAYKARKGRGRSGDIGLGKCFGAIRLLDNNNARIGKDHKASSTPAGSAGLHSERVALERCVRANWEPPLTNIMILGMQNSPALSEKNSMREESEQLYASRSSHLVQPV